MSIKKVLVKTAWITGVMVSFCAYGNGDSEGTELLEQKSYRNTEDNLVNKENLKHLGLAALMEKGVTVPGLASDFVPQGLAWIPGKQDLALLTGYVGEAKDATVFLMDMDKGVPLRVARLVNAEGDPLSLHAGGVAITGDYFWLPDRFKVLRFPLRGLLEINDAFVEIRKDASGVFGVDALGSFVASYDGHLWIGDYVGGKNPDVPHHAASAEGGDYHGWTAGYRLTENEDIVERDTYTVTYENNEYKVNKPHIVLHHRQRVQGAVFLGNGKVALSVSNVSNVPKVSKEYNDSKIAFYDLGEHFGSRSKLRHSELPDDSKVKSRVICNGDKNDSPTRWLLTLHGPPGAEQPAWNGSQWAVPFEGGATPYRNKWSRIEDRILILDLPARIKDH